MTRMVGNFRPINSYMKKITRAPNITELYDMDPEAEWFTTLDVSNAYHSLLLVEADSRRLCTEIMGRRYRWAVLPQGGKTSSQIFVAEIMKCLSPAMLPGTEILVYIDDVLVATRVLMTEPSSTTSRCPRCAKETVEAPIHAGN